MIPVPFPAMTTILDRMDWGPELEHRMVNVEEYWEIGVQCESVQKGKRADCVPSHDV